MASKPLKQQVHEAMEPALMQVPTMDRPSVALAWFMDTMIVEDKGCVGDSCPYLTCTLCGAEVMLVEEGDTLRVMFNTALAHGC